MGGVARPVDALLMAGLILYSAGPFEKAVQSQSRQLAFVFQACWLLHASTSSDPAAPASPEQPTLHMPTSMHAGWVHRLGDVVQPCTQTASAVGGCVRQGIDRLTLIFSQLVIASLAVSTITTLEVAVKWPESVVYVSILFFFVAIVRCVAAPVLQPHVIGARAW